MRFGNGIALGGAGSPTIAAGAGSPEGVVTAPVGSTYHRTDGGTGTTLYRKESGAGNTGWVAVSAITEATVTFTTPSLGRFFDVTVSGAIVGQKVLCSPSLNMPTGVAEDELEMDPLICHGHVKTNGQVRLFVGSARYGPLGGARNINLTIG